MRKRPGLKPVNAECLRDVPNKCVQILLFICSQVSGEARRKIVSDPLILYLALFGITIIDNFNKAIFRNQAPG